MSARRACFADSMVPASDVQTSRDEFPRSAFGEKGSAGHAQAIATIGIKVAGPQSVSEKRKQDSENRYAKIAMDNPSN